MYGHTLNGLIKNGVRLSYSKNPLGVRSPSLSNGSSGVSSYTSGYHSAHESSSGGRFAAKTSSFIFGEGRPRQDGPAEGPPPRHAANIANNFVANFGFDLPRSRHFSTPNEYTAGPVGDHRVAPPFGDATSPPPRFFAPNSAPAPSLASPPLSHGASSAFGSLSGGNYAGGSTFSPFGNDLATTSSATTSGATGTGAASSITSSFIDRNDPIVPPHGNIHNIPPQLHPHPGLNHHQSHHTLFNHHSQQHQHPLLDRYDGSSNSLYNIHPGLGDSRILR